MLFRVLAGFTPMIAGWMIYSGALPFNTLFSGGGYSADVAASPDQVAAALGDLNVNEITGSGLVPFVTSLSHERTAEGMIWKLNADGKTLLEMDATLTSSDGAHTHIQADARKGPDYDPKIMGAGLQDLAMINTVFGAAMKMELNEFAPPAERKAQVALEQERMATVTRAMTAKLMANPMAIAVEARRRELSFKDDMAKMQADQHAFGNGQNDGSVSFRPGEPMVNPNDSSTSFH